jgi:hypothetical protein
MNLKEQWPTIRSEVNNILKKSVSVALATVTPDGMPHVCPIGSLVLYSDCRGVYCEHYPRQLPKNLEKNARVCVLAVNAGIGYWLSSGFKGRFDKPAAIRLYGHAGAKRIISPDEMSHWRKRVRIMRLFNGYRLIWQDISRVRDIYFDRAERILSGDMLSIGSNSRKDLDNYTAPTY